MTPSPPQPPCSLRSTNELWIEFRLAFERVHATNRVYECIAPIAHASAIERVRTLLRELDADLARARAELEQAWRSHDGTLEPQSVRRNGV